MKYLHVLLCSFAVLTLSACGGSSSGGGSTFNPTDPNTEFRMSSAGNVTAGISETTNCTGSDTAGGVFIAVISQRTLAQTTFLSEQAIPIETLLQLTNTANGAFVSTIGTSYFSPSAVDRRYLGHSNSTTTTVSATTFSLPQIVKIGDFGNTGTYTDNAGDVEVQSWRVDDGGSGRAMLVSLSNKTDQFGTLQTSSVTSSLIDTNGNVISQSIDVYYATLGISLTLNCS